MLREPYAHLLPPAAAESLRRVRVDRARVPRRLRPVVAEIERNLFEPVLNVDRLKRIFGVRGSSMSALFRSVVGRTPRGYIEDRRCETAGRLLATADLKIWQIAELVGYSGLAAFTKAFSRWAGESPSVYRQRAGAGSGGGSAGVLGGEGRFADRRCADRRCADRRCADPEWLRRAVEGALSAPEARELIDRLLRRYPSLAAASGLR